MMKRKQIYSFFASLILLCFVGCNPAAKAEKNSNEPGWQVGILAYTFKDFTLFEAVQKAKELGIDHIGGFPGQKLDRHIAGHLDYKMDAETQEKVRAYLNENKMELVDVGVISPKTEEEWRTLFDFAKAMDIKTIVAEPEIEQLDLISNLCDSYQIKVAIHNHAAPSTYWNPDSLMHAIEGKSALLGVCADVGHWLRSGLDPVSSLQKVKSKLFELHFKDVSMKEKEGVDVVWGQGNIPLKDLLQELKDQSFQGVLAIEYEGSLHENMEEIKRSITYYKELLKSL